MEGRVLGWTSTSVLLASVDVPRLRENQSFTQSGTLAGANAADPSAHNDNPVRPDAAVRRKHDRAIPEALGSLDSFSDVDVAVHSDPFLIVVSV
jgi:hypothetical protein